MGTWIKKAIEGESQDSRYADLERKAKADDKQAEAEAQKMVYEAAKKAGLVVGERYTVRGKGLLNNQLLNRDKLSDDEDMELTELMDFGLQQPLDVPSDATFAFTEEGKVRHARLLELLTKAARGPVKQERIAGKVVWSSNDGQLALQAASSADAFTYRDDGTLIPLSERFDPGNPDIRF